MSSGWKIGASPCDHQRLRRDQTIPIADLVSETELRKCLDYIQAQPFSRTDLYYLRGMDLYDKHLFGEDFLEFLRSFRLPPYTLQKRDDPVRLAPTTRGNCSSEPAGDPLARPRRRT